MTACLMTCLYRVCDLKLREVSADVVTLSRIHHESCRYAREESQQTVETKGSEATDQRSRATVWSLRSD